jgi:peptidoglycan hydrolase CwlO-like protein
MSAFEYADDLRNIASQIDGLEENYDNITAELEDTEKELERVNDQLKELETYIAWAESYYPDMAGQYKAICDVRG